jgi:hypothetical protein
MRILRSTTSQSMSSRVQFPPSESQDGADMHLRGLGGGVVRALACCPHPVADLKGQETLPRSSFLVTNSADIPKVLRGFLSTMVDR